MASPNSISTLLFLFFSSFILLISSSSGQPSSVCKDTPHPSFCQSSLNPANATATVHDYARLSIRKSIAAATTFSNSIDKHLAAATDTAVIRALQDCQFLAQLNVDFLSTTFQKVNAGQTTLPTATSEYAQTVLSAVLTNTQTCAEGLQTNAAAWTAKKRHRIANARRQQIVGGGQAVVVSGVVVVSQDGSGDFTTISDAVNFAPNNSASSAGYFLINVTAGVYEEYVNIPKNKKYLMMIGDGINRTVITGNHSVADGWTTFNSATFIVTAPNFVAVNLTIRNTAGAVKHQAVALRNGADLSAFYSCSFEGYQDTLYTHSLRQFYRECDIYGTVDFIFGNAAVVFQYCNLYPRLPLSGQFNAVTAQGRTDPNQNTGTSIQKCNIRAADDLAASGGGVKTYLGRPWKEYSRTVYMQSFMDSLIDPAGWSIWSGDFALNTSYYAEFNNSGPGSDTSRRVTWQGFHVINETDAVNFTASVFIPGDEFLPQTGVPYDGGL
ncbi:hypothetical protein OSB04_022767 [Centaurea solstitialis]|uniref:Pectinesterase n=1 Tax=Centaurea solstitialis TaxID=347529 RepID=A0AA38SHW6_9ASTR|nr:hypothetical protein OSB04_022767 [Centaurea solstitialis]